MNSNDKKFIFVKWFVILFVLALSFILIFLIIDTQTSYASQHAQNEFSIMSYNLRYKDDTDSYIEGIKVSNTIESRALRVAFNIKHYMPDSVGIQEGGTSNWIVKLEDLLYPDYTYVGFGRDKNKDTGEPKGEASGIFYNRNRLQLLEAGTKWYSSNPDEVGSKYDKNKYKVVDSGDENKEANTKDGCARLFTYAIFKQISNDQIYMHINSHYDLGTGANLANAIDEMAFADKYKTMMPIFLTADFNAWYGAQYYDSKTDRYECQGVNKLIDYYKCHNAAFEVPGANNIATYPVKYYPGYDKNKERIIDYIFSVGDDVSFKNYQVITDLVKSNNDLHAGATSDHYPIFAKGTFKEPSVGYLKKYDPSFKDIAIDNSFTSYDANWNYLGTKSKYNNHYNIGASNNLDENNTNNNYPFSVETDGKLSADNDHTFANKKAISWNDIKPSNGLIKYNIFSECNTLADIDITLSKYPNRYVNLVDFVNLTVNNKQIDISNVNDQYTDTLQTYEWNHLVIKNQQLNKGLNTIVLNNKNNEIKLNIPNQLMIDIYSEKDINVKEPDIINWEIAQTNDNLLIIELSIVISFFVSILCSLWFYSLKSSKIRND